MEVAGSPLFSLLWNKKRKLEIEGKKLAPLLFPLSNTKSSVEMESKKFAPLLFLFVFMQLKRSAWYFCSTIFKTVSGQELQE